MIRRRLSRLFPIRHHNQCCRKKTGYEAFRSNPQGSGWILDDANGSNDAGQSVGLRHGQRANTSVLVEMICEVTPEPNWESLTLVSREVEASGTTGDLQQTKCCATA